MRTLGFYIGSHPYGLGQVLIVAVLGPSGYLVSCHRQEERPLQNIGPKLFLISNFLSLTWATIKCLQLRLLVDSRDLLLTLQLIARRLDEVPIHCPGINLRDPSCL